MQYIKLVDKQQNIKKVPRSFSLKYLLCGPFYLFFVNFFGLGFLLLLVYYFFLPIYGLRQLCEVLHCPTDLKNIICFFRTVKGFMIGGPLIIVLHLSLCYFLPRIIIKKMVDKKNYLPYSPTDKKFLIKKCGAQYQRTKHYLNYLPTLEFLKKDLEKKSPKIRYVDVLFSQKKDPNLHLNDRQIQGMLQQVFDEYRLGLISSQDYQDYNEKILNLQEKKLR